MDGFLWWMLLGVINSIHPFHRAKIVVNVHATVEQQGKEFLPLETARPPFLQADGEGKGKGFYPLGKRGPRLF